MFQDKFKSFLLIAIFILFLFTVNQAGALAQPRNPAEAFADLVRLIMERTTDSAIDYRINSIINGSVKDKVQDIISENPGSGILLTVRIYKDSNGFSYLPSNGVDFVGFGKNASTVYCFKLKTGSISSPAPRGLLFNKQSSYMIWLKQFGSAIEQRNIKYPLWERVIRKAEEKLRAGTCS